MQVIPVHAFNITCKYVVLKYSISLHDHTIINYLKTNSSRFWFFLHQLPSHHIKIMYLFITIIYFNFDLPFDIVHQDNLLNQTCFLYAQQEKIHFASPKNTAEIKMKHWLIWGQKRQRNRV